MRQLWTAIRNWIGGLFFFTAAGSPFLDRASRAQATSPKGGADAASPRDLPAPIFPDYTDRLILDFRANRAWYQSHGHLDHAWRHQHTGAALLVPASGEALMAEGERLTAEVACSGWDGIIHFHVLNADGRTLRLCRILDAWEKRFGRPIEISFESRASAALGALHRDAVLGSLGLLHLDAYLKRYTIVTVSPRLEGAVRLPDLKALTAGRGPIEAEPSAGGMPFLTVWQSHVGHRYAELLKAYILATFVANLPGRPPVGLAPHAIKLCADRLRRSASAYTPQRPGRSGREARSTPDTRGNSGHIDTRQA